MRKTFKSRYDGTEFGFNLEEDKKYGIMVSGGLDSALLFYMIMSTYKERGWTPKLQPFTIRKHNERIQTARSIISWINEKFPDHVIPDTIVLGNPDDHHRLQGDLAWKEVRSRYPDINYVFYGSNAVPNWDYSNWEKDQMGFPVGVPQRGPGEGGMVYLPFYHLRKYHTVDLVMQLDIPEVYTMSRSCTYVADGPRCKLCFHCRERAWGFAMAGITDPGIW